VAAEPLAVLAGAMVPQPGEQDTPFWVRLQVTPVLVPSFATVAVSCCVAFNATLTGVGDTETEIGTIVMDARLNAVVFVTELA
jgi:hypothetical protein